ncbi:MAG: ATP-binding protein [Chitinispirillales bacterium]|jgi:predicted AAA+ superfamily ATPase|nr:ATP-binding protein [Chitinispirillales bacterium]
MGNVNVYSERTVGGYVRSVSNQFKVILVTGMRQVGKTTCLRNIAEGGRRYITLDDPKILSLAKSEPELFFERFAPPLLIDEIQYAPELFPYIKMLADNAGENGLFWLSGSQRYSMMKNVTESLAGRAAIIDMLGFSIYERGGKGGLQKPFLPSGSPNSLLGPKSSLDTFKIIWQGSYPQIAVNGGNDWNLFYSSYVKSYIERDVRNIINIGDEMAFHRFIGVIAARTAQSLNMSDIAQNSNITVKTAEKWLSILQASGIVYLLKPYFSNVSKRFTKHLKLYFTDTGLCAYLTEWTSPETLSAGAMSGAFFETFVITEILKSYLHNGLTPNLYYYRDSNKVEIDLLISENGLLYPIEIKKTANPKKEDIKAFNTLAAIAEIGHGSLVCLVKEKIPITDSVNAISVWEI